MEGGREARGRPDRAYLCHLPLAVAALKNSAGFINFLASIDRIHPMKALHRAAGHHQKPCIGCCPPCLTPHVWSAVLPRDLAFQGLFRRVVSTRVTSHFLRTSQKGLLDLVAHLSFALVLFRLIFFVVFDTHHEEHARVTAHNQCRNFK